jgi:DNA invertase Pin-like site-specific DNA recombinase
MTTNTNAAAVSEAAATSAEPAQRKAYSYVRFSSPKQREGDSERRQTEKAAKFASDNGLELDTELNLRDLSVSAYRGGNAKTGKLSVFLNAVESGLVPPGSFLLIENIDRLTRDDILDASELFLGIIRMGVVVVTLTNGISYSKEELKSNPYLMMMIVLELIRANQESARKAQLSSDNYHQKTEGRGDQRHTRQTVHANVARMVALQGGHQDD